MVTSLALLLQRIPKMGSFSHNLLANRDVVIPRGAGKGLRFNAGSSNVDYALGRNEASVQEALRRVLKPADVFYDIGANVGFFTVIGARLSGPRGRVLAFEPVPENVQIIRRNLTLNQLSTVDVHEVAVARTSGTAELLLADYAGGAALASAPPPPDVRGSMLVRTVAVDDLVEDGSPPPDVVKIDVEGAEIEVFEGLARTLERYNPVILYEVDAGDAPSFAAHAAACAGWLRARGYESERLPDCYAQSDWFVGNFLARR